MKAVRTSQQADLHILEIDAWWSRNRDKAPNLFMEELAAAFDLIGRHPMSGKLVRGVEHPGVRRLPLRKTRFHIYYLEIDDHVLVVAVWSGARGIGPDLRSR